MATLPVLSMLLLCSLSLAELQENVIPESVNVPQPCPSDIHTVLRDMSVTLAVLQTRMEQMHKTSQEQNAKLAKYEVVIQDLQNANKEHTVKLTNVDTLTQQLQEQNDEVRTLKQQQKAFAADVMSIKTWANVTESQVEYLRRKSAVGQVAFSASLVESGAILFGPFNAHTNLAFKHVISNIGNAYNPNTGFFIAPVKGAYHFEFYVGSWSDDYHSTAVVLVKNGEHIVKAHERGPQGHSSAANGATLLLEPGDVVFLRLWLNKSIHDDQHHRSTFSGHLLFPM